MQDYWLNPVMEDQRAHHRVHPPSSLSLRSSHLSTALSLSLSPPLSSGEKEAAACRQSSCARRRPRSPSSSRGRRAGSDAAGPAVVEEGPSRAGHVPPGRAAGGDPRRWAGRTRGAMAPSRPRARSGGAERAAGGERRSRAGTGEDRAGDQSASAAAARKRGAPRLRLGGRGRGRGIAADRPWRDPVVAAEAAWAAAERWVQGRGWYADSAPTRAEDLGGVGGVEGGRRAGGGDGYGGGVRGAGGEFFLAGDQASTCA